MSPTPSTPAMRARTPLRQLWLLTALSLLCLLAWDFSGLDMRVMQTIADHRGFGLRSNWWCRGDWFRTNSLNTWVLLRVSAYRLA